VAQFQSPRTSALLFVGDRKLDLAEARLTRLADQFQTAGILTPGKDFEIHRWGRNNPFRTVLSLK
jgi:hypothetical protein